MIESGIDVTLSVCRHGRITIPERSKSRIDQMKRGEASIIYYMHYDQ